jgi:hypothetical protein
MIENEAIPHGDGDPHASPWGWIAAKERKDRKREGSLFESMNSSRHRGEIAVFQQNQH